MMSFKPALANVLILKIIYLYNNKDNIGKYQFSFAMNMLARWTYNNYIEE